MKIGLDFDGVITDCGNLKTLGARTLFSTEIPPEMMKKEVVTEAGLLTLEQYREIQELVYCTRDVGLQMTAVAGMRKFLPLLQLLGFLS